MGSYAYKLYWICQVNKLKLSLHDPFGLLVEMLTKIEVFFIQSF